MGAVITGLDTVSRHDREFAERIRSTLAARLEPAGPETPAVAVDYDDQVAPALAHVKFVWRNRVVVVGLRADMTSEQLDGLLAAVLVD